MPRLNTISPCLWFDHDASAAVDLYTSVFPDSRITQVERYTEAGREQHRMPPGSVMYIDFELAGQRFAALNGGPQFRFSPAVSLQVFCATQDEIDHYWNALAEGGAPEAQICGWLADRFGLSWQIVPAEMGALMQRNGPAVMAALMGMHKLDLAALRRAAAS
jgi:predicted 3-demethylubiquinone-9 3-methyltransferase (glyoxalase superfamily)